MGSLSSRPLTIDWKEKISDVVLEKENKMIQDLRFVEREIEYGEGGDVMIEDGKYIRPYKMVKILQAYDGKEWRDVRLEKEE